VDAAQTECDAAFKANPSEPGAGACLDRINALRADLALDEADAQLADHNLSKVEELAMPVLGAASSDVAHRHRAGQILAEVRRQTALARVTPTWLLDLVVALAILGLGWLALYITRGFWRGFRRFNSSSLRQRTTWAVLPVKEDAKDNLEATAVILDALSRLPRELSQHVWQPKLLLLRPTPPATYEPEIIDEFLCSDGDSVVLLPPADQLDLRCDLHDWQFDEAVQGLQLKIQNVDLGSVAKFVRSIWRWLNTPSLTGIAEVTEDKRVVVRLSASGGASGFVAVAASTEGDAGVDGIRLSAERAVFKLLYRLRYPAKTQTDVDGQAALRQAVRLFAQYAGSSAGSAADVQERTAALKKAGYNFGYARACLAGLASDELDVRPAVLLAEGVVYALLNDHGSALERFRQLEDWPNAEGLSVLRSQARYNSAVILGRMGKPGAAVLELTNLLGERPTDLGVEAKGAEVERQRKGENLGSALQFVVRLARAAGLANYDEEAWLRLSRPRAQMVIQDSKKLLEDLAGLKLESQPHDARIADYLSTETLRARGTILLNFVKNLICDDLYVDGRPTELKRKPHGSHLVAKRHASPEGHAFLREGIDNMQRCEEHAGGTANLFCDLAEAKLLVEEYDEAEQYARQATLVNTQLERGYYLAAEICYLSGTAEQLERAKKYARAYHGETVSDMFSGLMDDLEVTGTRERAQSA
jgi:hypothetical protein